MNEMLGSIDAADRHLEHRNAARRVDPAAAAGHQLRIVGPLDGDLRPPVELEPVEDDQVGPAELDHLARPDLEVVGVLVAPGEGVDLDEIAAHRLDQRPQLGRGRDDAQLRGPLHPGAADDQ